MRDWEGLEAFAAERKSPVGWEPFLQEARKGGAPREYMARCVSYWATWTHGAWHGTWTHGAWHGTWTHGAWHGTWTHGAWATGLHGHVVHGVGTRYRQRMGTRWYMVHGHTVHGTWAGVEGRGVRVGGALAGRQAAGRARTYNHAVVRVPYCMSTPSKFPLFQIGPGRHLVGLSHQVLSRDAGRAPI